MSMEFLKIECETVRKILCRFLTDEAEKAGFTKVVLGLSGGIDSALVSYLCADAFRPENVTALIMPYRTSNPQNIEDAKRLAKLLNIQFEVFDISPMVDTFYQSDPDADYKRKGNRQ